MYRPFVSSPSFEALSPPQKLDSLLLSDLLAITFPVSSVSGGKSYSMDVFHSLLPVPETGYFPVPPFVPPIPLGFVKGIYSRFGNNNFTIHSHLNSTGHGVFPLASLLFNHSCFPNAAVRFRFQRAKPVTLEVVALQDIRPNEELCISYVDPALVQSRQHILQQNYGFSCICSSCQFIAKLGKIPLPPTNLNDLDILGGLLRQFTAIEERQYFRSNFKIEDIPRSLLPVFHEKYVADLSEKFSKTSHEGQYDMAICSGITLLAVYTLLYPDNYPQIGMHLLELAKTAWNKNVSSKDVSREAELAVVQQAQMFLSRAKDVLEIFGQEGDENGPLKEIELLQSFLDS